MSALHDFDEALALQSGADSDAWADDGVVFIGGLAATLTTDDLVMLRVLWTARPPLWQKHCAEVLEQSAHGDAIELLIDMAERGGSDVALAALESLGNVDPGLISPPQNARILRAVGAALGWPVTPLRRMLLARFRTRLEGSSPGGA